MFLKFLRNTLIIVLCIVFLTVPTSAGWLDNWFNQAVSTAPNYFEGQKRGYFTAGSFSARIPTSTDYLISVEKPRVKFGCGGIDMFLGGFSFANFEYLVQKFQRLIQAAPIVAFQIALNTLSSTLKISIEKAEEIINALNSLQMNECQILKPFTTIDLSKDNAGAQFEAAAKAALDSTGATNLFYALGLGTKTSRKKDEVKTSSGTTIEADKTIEGCPAQLQQFLMQTANKYFSDYMILQNPGMSTFIPYLRSIVGDVEVIKGTSAYGFSYYEGCAQAKTDLFKENILYIKTDPKDSSSCMQESTKFKDKIANILADAQIKALSKSTPRSEYYNLARMSPLPVHMFMRYAVVTNDPTVPYVIADSVAKGAFYQATLDMIREIDKVLASISSIPRMSDVNKDQTKACSQAVSQGAVDAITKLRGNLVEFAHNLHQAYIASLSESSQIAQHAHLYKQFEEKAYQNLTQKFGSGVASRVFTY